MVSASRVPRFIRVFFIIGLLIPIVFVVAFIVPHFVSRICLVPDIVRAVVWLVLR